MLGVNSPDTNNADIRNEGWELTLGWRDQFSLASKSFNYSVSFNLSDYQGTVLKYSNPKGLIYDYYVGKKMGTIWGYTTDHIMTDPAEAKAIKYAADNGAVVLQCSWGYNSPDANEAL